MIASCLTNGSPAARIPSALYAELLSRGRRCFLDREDLYNGVALNPSIEKALRKSRTMVIIATPGALASGAVNKEVNIYKISRRPIIPINIDETLNAAAPVDTLAGFLWEQLVNPEPVPGAVSPSPDVVEHSSAHSGSRAP